MQYFIFHPHHPSRSLTNTNFQRKSLCSTRLIHNDLATILHCPQFSLLFLTHQFIQLLCHVEVDAIKLFFVSKFLTLEQTAKSLRWFLLSGLCCTLKIYFSFPHFCCNLRYCRRYYNYVSYYWVICKQNLVTIPFKIVIEIFNTRRKDTVFQLPPQGKKIYDYTK